MARRKASSKRRSETGKRSGSRPIWRGSLSFGLVNIPVSLYPAETSNELSFNLLDRRDFSPVRYRRVNEKTGKEVPWDEIVKGYEHAKGEYVPLTEGDFRSANAKATQTIEIIDFVPAAEIDPVYYDRPYYLEPAKSAAKSYALLREVMRRTQTVGIAKVVLRSRQHLAAVVPRGPVLVLILLRFAHELRDPGALEVPGDANVGAKEIEMAERLVETMIDRWQPEKYRDEYRDDLLKLVEQKVKSGKTKVIEEKKPEAARRPGKVIDIMDLLKRSVEQGRRREQAAPRRRKAG
ncbi:MAG: Ku protein [Candidatus Binatia bacterium]